ncbi:TetR/AcrR family transcriptional regulator [Paraburkholderia phenoliruptrix]|uniref:TetR/AcrR family transcriptional regulator n=1 Tax=Paraburkholderia phenoliruptrix TaxID=252970 RepID=A0ABV3WGP4_9BURK|nr:helix-turn-helix domain-containing protein [Paraburkholderia phenoliruptrix]MDR6393348.1 AcrR family transcriptional regulator [Paraburkholderia phenoliruptrix]
MKCKRLTHEERRLQTRERLLEAAHELFVARGYVTTGLEEIAEAAGYARGAFYSNFTDKTDLLIESLRRHRIGLPYNLRAVIGVLNHYLRSDEDFRLWVEAGPLASRQPAFRERFDAIVNDA